MRRYAFALLAALLSAQAQTSAPASVVAMVPPACPGIRKSVPHPSAADVLRTQEQGSADASVLLSPEPVGNMGLLRYAVRDYADCTGASGCYWADLEAQTRRAEAVLEQGVRESPRGAKLALVLDIDETALSSYCEEVREDFGYIPDRFEAWITSTEASIPVPGTVRLAHRAQALGVAVFFITGRPDSQRAATETNLAAAGYSGWKHLSLKQPADAGRTTGDYKSAERQKIVDGGYMLVLNMGDQWSDLQGAPMAQHSVKLPNPFYYLP